MILRTHLYFFSDYYYKMTYKNIILNNHTSSDGGKSSKRTQSENIKKNIKNNYKKTNSKKLRKTNQPVKKQQVYGLFYDDCLYHKQYQDKCPTVKFMKVPTQESSLRKATKLLGNNEFKDKVKERSRGNLSYYKISGMTLKQMNQLIKLVNHPKSKVKFVFLDFDKTITVHEGFYTKADFTKLYLKPLKWKLPLNPYGPKNISKQLKDLKYGDLIPNHSDNSQLHCFRKYYLGGDIRLNKFIETMNELLKNKIKIYIITANKKSVVNNFMNCARMKFFRKIYSLQDYKKKQKYDLIKAIMKKFNMPTH